MSSRRIIEVFSGRGHGHENVNSTGASDVVLDDIDNKILLKENVESLKDSPDLFPYIWALFSGSKGNSKECLRRLGKLFNVSIELLKQGKFAKHQATELLEVMLSVIRLFNTKQTDSSILTILKDFSPDPLNESNVYGHSCVLQLLPQLVTRNGEVLCRTYTLEMICEMTFPVTSAVILSATLVDLCESEEDLRKTIAKIKAYVKWNFSSLRGKSSNIPSTNDNIFTVEPEDLPALIYQLTNLSRKYENSNDNALIALGKKLVVEALTEVLDFLFHEACLYIDVLESTSRCSSVAVSARIHNIMSTIVHHLSLLVSKDQGISSEIVKLIKSKNMLIMRTTRRVVASLDLPHPDLLGNSISATVSSQPPLLTCAPTASPAPPPEHTQETLPNQPPVLSPSRLLLAFLAAKAPRLEDSILQGICESIQEVYTAQNLHLQSLWFSPGLWAEASQALALTPYCLQQVFVQIITGPLMVESIVSPLLKCACGLLQSATANTGSSSGGGGSTSSALKALSTLSTTSLSISPTSYESLYLQTIVTQAPAHSFSTSFASSNSAVSSAAGFGAWLLIQLFLNCRHARFPIIRELVQRLQMVISFSDSPSSTSSSLHSHFHKTPTSPSFSSGASPLPDQCPLEKLLLGVLNSLTSSSLCLEGILESTMDVGFTTSGSSNNMRVGRGGGSIVQELMELFLALPSLLPRTAGQLVQVMVPLLRHSSGLADRCALSLRKASFSKDVGSRLSAVSALMTLLHVQLLPRVVSSSSSSSSSSSRNSSCSSGGNSIPGVLSIEEVLSLCRRFLHHQAPVRSLLYDRLLHLHVDVPSFRSLSIRLLRMHLITLLLDHDNTSDVGGSRYNVGDKERIRRESLDILSVESPRHLLFLNLDACVDSSGQSQEAVYDLLTSLTAMVKTSCAALLVLRAKQARMVAREVLAAEAAATAAQSGGRSENNVPEDDREEVVAYSQVQCTQYGYFSQAEVFPATSSSPTSANTHINASQSANGSVNVSGKAIGGMSRSTSRSQRRLDEFAQEVDEAFVVLWRLCCGLARGRPQDFSLPVQPSTRKEYCRYMFLVEALQAALCCVACLPHNHEVTTTDYPMDLEEESDDEGNLQSDTEPRRPSILQHRDQVMNSRLHKSVENTYVMYYLTPTHRIQLFTLLAQQLETYSTVLLLYRKQEKEADKFRAKRGAGGGGGGVVEGMEGEDTPAAHTQLPSPPLSLPKHLGGYQSAEALNAHGIETELELCVFGLDALFMTRGETEDEVEEEESVEGARRKGTDFGEEKDRDEVEAEEASLMLRRSLSSPFLRKHLLERSLYCLELTLKYLHLHAVSTPTSNIDSNMHPDSHSSASSSSSSSSNKSSANPMHLTMSRQPSTQHHLIIAQCHSLFQCLMRVLIKLRSEDKENACELGTQHLKNFHTANNSNLATPAASGSRRTKESGSEGGGDKGNAVSVSSTSVGSLIFPTVSHHQYLYPNQLVLRCMLGCLRAENMHSLHLSQTFTAALPFKPCDDFDLEGKGGDEKDGEEDNVQLQQQRAQFRMERLTSLLEEGFKVGHSGSRRRFYTTNTPGVGLTLTNNTCVTGLTGGVGGTLRETESRLEKQVKKFLDLFLLLSARDGTERNESPLVVSLLGEVAEVLSPNRRQKLQETILRKCREHLQTPTNAITSALLQLMIFKIPAVGKSRIESLKNLCLLVTECCTTEQQLDAEDENDDDDDEEDDREVTTYTLVTKHTAATAITSLVGILDKMCGELDTLLKLSVKTAKAYKASCSAHTTSSSNSSSRSRVNLTSSDITIAAIWDDGGAMGGGGGRAREAIQTCTANDTTENQAVGWHVNDQICKSLRVCMDIAMHFLSFKSSGAVCHSLLGLFLKIIKLHVKITKVICGSPATERAHVTTSSQYQSFRDLSINMAANVAQGLNRYVTEVHNLLDGHTAAIGRGKAKGGRGGRKDGAAAQASGGKAILTKLSRLIPELSFQMEEIDLHVIKLMTGLKERDKGIMSKWLCKLAARDFRLNAEVITTTTAATSNTATNSRKRKTNTTETDKFTSRKKRNGADDNEDDVKIES